MTKPSKAPGSRAGSLPLIGGALALDFCNTASGRGTDSALDHIVCATHLLSWARHSGIVDATANARLQRLCDADPAFGSRLLARALALRDATYRLDAALAQARTPDQDDIDTVAGTHAACLANGRLATRDGVFGWTWRLEDTPAEVILGPIAASAMSIITGADRARLKQCRGHHCGWLFLDTTKNNRRVWCEMEVCGNRAKQRRRRSRAQDGDGDRWRTAASRSPATLSPATCSRRVRSAAPGFPCRSGSHCRAGGRGPSCNPPRHSL